jgi:hypothetical protein
VTLSWMPRSHPTSHPTSQHFEDFKQWLEEIYDYLPYLPRPLHQHLGDDQLFVTLKKCVPAWQKKCTDSNAHKNIGNVNDLATTMATLRIKRRRNATETINTRIGTQAKVWINQQRTCSPHSNETK